MAENVSQAGQDVQDVLTPTVKETELEKAVHNDVELGAEFQQECGQSTDVGQAEGPMAEGRATAGETPAETKTPKEEGNKIMEGEQAEIGEKRQRPEGEREKSAGEQEDAEKEAGKEAKKLKEGESSEQPHEKQEAPKAKKGRGRKGSGQKVPMKRKEEKGSTAVGEEKKRPGRPRKDTTVAKQQQNEPKSKEAPLAKGVSSVENIPAHYTRSYEDP